MNYMTNMNSLVLYNKTLKARVMRQPPPGGGGDFHMKEAGMLVVSLMSVNFRFWSRLGCSGQNTIIFSCKGLVSFGIAHEEILGKRITNP